MSKIIFFFWIYLYSTPPTQPHQVHLASQYKSRGVVGIDLSGNPHVGNVATFLPALHQARALGLHLAIHVGEVPSPQETDAVFNLVQTHATHPGLLINDVSRLKDDVSKYIDDVSMHKDDVSTQKNDVIREGVGAVDHGGG